uniref:Uncharacterized protein n=1 Tax=Phlegmariurus squarrosus TaxID=73615 RepID=H9M882_PHLSQ|nr:hypothetical protein HusqMp107 [Phlegmariurus squarrosus]AEV55789.1 hypothetical protein HusqMp107 [Phlegmariurus squarrosus]
MRSEGRNPKIMNRTPPQSTLSFRTNSDTSATGGGLVCKRCQVKPAKVWQMLHRFLSRCFLCVRCSSLLLGCLEQAQQVCRPDRSSDDLPGGVCSRISPLFLLDGPAAHC